ncbi:MAG: TIGR04282 family arsenosugar biosynthesis glycosyltransferase [bacterium]|nr:TIGR04282 family arsenosugar biosynthesis glycosyltransferase [bacterium]
MAKAPRPGTVKTRLAAHIGPEAACRLQRAFIADLASRLPAAGLPIHWAVTPPDGDLGIAVAADRRLVQEGDDLGTRMAHAMAAVHAVHGGPVVTVGTDSPHLDPMTLRAAAAALGRDCDVVLGPADDGGYWCVGTTVPPRELFTGVAWGTGAVLATTEANAARAGLRVARLPRTFDVDDAAGLRGLRALLAAGAVALPATAAALATLPAD